MRSRSLFVFQEQASSVMEVNEEEIAELSDHHYEALKILWADEGVQKCYDRRREFQISDSAK